MNGPDLNTQGKDTPIKPEKTKPPELPHVLKRNFYPIYLYPIEFLLQKVV
ncbi:MAG: hypothetical protein H0W88_02050 [Parachlamydiaceae bacterium]|nr:hypothetical protein [Parachlamydiaceae bacterium]